MKFDETPVVSSGGEGKSGLFLKLKNGESVTGLCQGEPFVYKATWNGKNYEEDPQGKFRFRINFIVNEDKKYVAKILEQGAVVYNMLKDLNIDYPLEETLIKVTRNGDGTDTTYSILPVPPKQQPTEAQLAVVKKAELHVLGSESKSLPNHAAKFNSDEEIPF